MGERQGTRENPPFTGGRGRPRTKQETQDLIIKFARENNWGYTRILGELKKLRIQCISRSTVKNILKENGLEPASRQEQCLLPFSVRIVQTGNYSCGTETKNTQEKKHLRHLVTEYVKYYNTKRPHSGLNNMPIRYKSKPPNGRRRVCCKSALGGMIKHYYWN